MKKSRFSEVQIIGVLKEADAGMKVADLCRKHASAEIQKQRDSGKRKRQNLPQRKLRSALTGRHAKSRPSGIKPNFCSVRCTTTRPDICQERK
ncbi:hypothetical protein CUJ88_44465 (plasmid) [Paraburkholderia hospita]|nr:hypothetical protein CUJ88_44465 [Paraburkholderia hospita]